MPSRLESQDLVGDSPVQRDLDMEEAEARFKFHGSPLIPADAIHMADVMIDAGMGPRWTCWHILGL